MAKINLKKRDDEPGSPPSGRLTVYVDDSDNIKTKTSAGSVGTLRRQAKRVQTVTSGATITPDCDAYDMVKQANTQGAGTLTVANPAGTPTDGQELQLFISAGNGAQTLTWGNAYAATDSHALTASVPVSDSFLWTFQYFSSGAKWYLRHVCQVTT